MSGFRATKAGDAFRLEEKFETRYDEEEKLGTPAAIMSWVAKVMGSDAPPCPGTGWQEIHNYLKDGVILCKLINKLSTFAGKPTTTFKAKATSSFVAMSNIENFNNAAKEFGVPQTALFQTPDLYEGRKGPMLNVINCLNQLGFVTLLFLAINCEKMLQYILCTRLFLVDRHVITCILNLWRQRIASTDSVPRALIVYPINVQAEANSKGFTPKFEGIVPPKCE